MSYLPPDWAIERALDVADYRASVDDVKERRTLLWSAVLAFARYIVDHEDAPVDPLLIEARKLAEQFWPGEGALAGKLDAAEWTQRLLVTLRRGMELAASGEA